jgi:hypothetical protein
MIGAGLPEGIFAYKNPNLGMYGKPLNGHLGYLTAIWYILWPFGIYFPVYFRGIWYILWQFGYNFPICCTIWQPWISDALPTWKAIPFSWQNLRSFFGFWYG